MHHAKAPSAGSTEATGSSRALLRRALATRAASRGSEGSGAPASRRARGLLAVLALAIAAFALTAAPASAAPPSTKMGAISDVSYTTAHVTGKVTTDGSGFNKFTAFAFQYSTDEINWSTGYRSDVTTNIQGAATDKEVEATLSVPKGSTHYFVRLIAQNGFFVPDTPAAETGVSPGPNPDFTTLAVDPPALPGTVEASPVFSLSAKATGKVKRPANGDPAFDVNCRFEYITDAQFLANEGASEPGFTGATSIDCAENPVDKADLDGEPETKVTADLTGLELATTYHLRLIAENAAPGTVVKDGTDFTTAPKVAAPSVIAADEASEVTYNSAVFTGKVQRPAGEDPALDTECHFEYIADAQFTANEGAGDPVFTGAQTVDCAENPIAGEAETPVSAGAALLPETTYHLRLVAENEGGSDSMVANTFTTPEAKKPTVTIDPIESGAFTAVHVTGTVTLGDGYNSATGASEAFVQYSSDGGATWESSGMLSARASSEPVFRNGNIGPGESVEGLYLVKGDVTGLQPSTTYLFRIADSYNIGFTNNGGAAVNMPLIEARGEVGFSPVETITTEPPQPAPTATDLAITGVIATSAHLSATVDPHAPAGPLSPLGKKAFATHWEFVCTPECKNANGNPIEGTVQGEEGAKEVSGDTKRLDPNTEYEVSLVIHSEGGEETVVETFNTPLIKPTVKAADGGSDGKGGYTLQGLVNPNGSPVSDCKFEWGPNSADYAFSADCSPMPAGRDEVQSIGVNATVGQFKLAYRGQTTGDIAVGAAPAVVEAELEALSLIGPNVTVTGGPDPSPKPYLITFGGSLAQRNVSQIRVEVGTGGIGGSGSQTGLGFSTQLEGGNSSAVTVEAHLTGLNPNVVYHYNLLATNGAGTSESGDQEFTPTLSQAEVCPNEQRRSENSSLALPECRAYEMVTPPGKEGFGAELRTYDGGDRVGYKSEATNIAKSGQSFNRNYYVAARSAAGWETIPNLNGSSGTFADAPSYVDSDIFKTDILAYSPDLRSSVWDLHRKGDPGAPSRRGTLQLRSPDGAFTRIGSATTLKAGITSVEFSADLSHAVMGPDTGTQGAASEWGPGVYEFLGTGMNEPRRVDIDNFDTPVSSCIRSNEAGPFGNAETRSVSSDGSRIVVYVYGGCGGANPPVDELWARINGTTSIDISGSQCNRTASDLGGVCNGPVEPGGCFPDVLSSGESGSVIASRHGCRDATFVAATPDGSRVFFTTTQQLVNGDTDQTRDIYACDIPSGNPAPSADKANHCAALRQVSGAQSGAGFEGVNVTSENGATVIFTAKGALTDDEDALGEKALAGDHNLYAWRTDAAHPDGQTSFLGRLGTEDVGRAQSTPDGRYLVFTTTSQLLGTDTDSARDVYRYDADSGELTRASTNLLGVGGNGEGFDVRIDGGGEAEHHPTTAISDDGQKIVFTTTEALSPADGNAEPDVYLWTPTRVSLVSTGSSGFAPRDRAGTVNDTQAIITGSGADIYFESNQQLTPADSDGSADVYDARVGGGFSFAQAASCSGEACQPPASGRLAAPAPATAQPPVDPGNIKPRTCPKGKVRKHNKCVKKPKKHSGKKHHGKKAAHKRGGGK